MKRMKKSLKVICVAVLLFSMVLQGTEMKENVQAAPAIGENEGNLLSYSHFSIDSKWNIATNGATASYESDVVPAVGTTNVRKISWAQDSNASGKIAYAIQSVAGINVTKSYKFSMWVKIEAANELDSPFLTRFIAKWTEDTGAKSRFFDSREKLTNTQGNWVKYETILNFEDNAANATAVKNVIDNGGEVSFEFRIVMPCQSGQDVNYYFTDACLTEVKEEAVENLMPCTSNTGQTVVVWGSSHNNNTVERPDANSFKITTKSTTTGGVQQIATVSGLAQNTTYRISFDAYITGGKANASDFSGVPFSITCDETSTSVAKITSTNNVTKHFEFTFTPTNANSYQKMRFRFARPATGEKDIIYTISNICLTKETAVSENKYSNGDFLRYDGGIDFTMATATTAFKWGNATNAAKNLDYEVIPTAEHGNALKLTAVENANSLVLQNPVVLEKNTEYLISYWIKAEQGTNTGTWGGVYTRMQEKDGGDYSSSAKTTNYSAGYKVDGATDGWKQISFRHKTLEGFASGNFDFVINHNAGAVAYIADVQIVKAPTVIDTVDLDGIHFDSYKWNDTLFSFAESLGKTGYTIVERWEQIENGRFYTSNATINSGLLPKETFTANTFEPANTHRYSIVLQPEEGYCIDTTTRLVRGESAINAKIFYLDDTGAIIDYNQETTLPYTVKGILVYPEGNELFTTVAGDCTKNGEADILDLVRMKRYVLDSTADIVFFKEACDFDNNETINDIDFKEMRQLLVR